MHKTIKIWIAWAPSSGKTTLINYLRDNQDSFVSNFQNIKEVLINSEVARELIEKKVRAWLTLDEIYSDSYNLQKQVLEENVLLFQLSNSVNWIVFFDTTIVCDWVFQMIYSNWIFLETIDYINKYRYDYIFFTEHTGFIESDGIRIDNSEENLRIGKQLEEMYVANNYTINYLPTFLPKWIDPKCLKNTTIKSATKKRFNYIVKHLKRNINL